MCQLDGPAMQAATTNDAQPQPPPAELERWVVVDKRGDTPEFVKSRLIAERLAEINDLRWPSLAPHRILHATEWFPPTQSKLEAAA